MRSLLIPLLAGVVSLSPLSCSDESNDPIGDRCVAICTINNTHHCFTATLLDTTTGQTASAMTFCINLCKQASGNANKKYGRAGCGLCLANSFSYQLKTDAYCTTGQPDPTCCYGPKQGATATDSTCGPLCLEPDGGLYR